MILKDLRSCPATVCPLHPALPILHLSPLSKWPLAFQDLLPSTHTFPPTNPQSWILLRVPKALWGAPPGPRCKCRLHDPPLEGAPLVARLRGCRQEDGAWRAEEGMEPLHLARGRDGAGELPLSPFCRLTGTKTSAVKERKDGCGMNGGRRKGGEGAETRGQGRRARGDTRGVCETTGRAGDSQLHGWGDA